MSVTETDIVWKLEQLSLREFERAVRSGKVAFVTSLFDLPRGEFTRQTRQLKRLMARLAAELREQK